MSIFNSYLGFNNESWKFFLCQMILRSSAALKESLTKIKGWDFKYRGGGGINDSKENEYTDDKRKMGSRYKCHEGLEAVNMTINFFPFLQQFSIIYTTQLTLNINWFWSDLKQVEFFFFCFFISEREQKKKKRILEDQVSKQ